MSPRLLAQTLVVLGKNYSADGIPAMVERFVNYATTRGWHTQFPRVIEILGKIDETDYDVTVSSAAELSEAEKASLATLFPTEKIHYITDANLVGGIKIQRGDELWDMTTSRMLDDLQTLLSA